MTCWETLEGLTFGLTLLPKLLFSSVLLIYALSGKTIAAEAYPKPSPRTALGYAARSLLPALPLSSPAPGCPAQSPVRATNPLRPRFTVSPYLIPPQSPSCRPGS